jgi:hypothetical protein
MLVDVDSDRLVHVLVTLVVTILVVVTMSLHLYFRVAGWGKKRDLYPPFGW